jgi:predicted deacylase
VDDVDPAPDVTDHGDDDRPPVAVVGGVHGDEPSGVRAVRRLRTAFERGELTPERPVRLVVANPSAVAAGERYLDSDLNRAFPGDPDGDHESRLAAALADATDGLLTLSLHATRSSARPFALVDGTRPALLEHAAALPVPHVVDTSPLDGGTHSTVAEVVTVEAGRQGTDRAATQAHELALAFLRDAGVLAGRPGGHPTGTRFLSMVEPVSKPPADRYELLVYNFRRVEAGEPFARADGRSLVAAEPFSPVLMSADGYEELFGYAGRALGDDLASAIEAVRDGIGPVGPLTADPTAAVDQPDAGEPADEALD